MEVNAGKMDKRIEILRYAETRNGAGFLAPAVEPEVVHRCWAQFTRVSGTEAQKRGADLGEVRVRFLIRATRKPIDVKMFVRYRGKDYEIEYINDYEDRHEYTELICRWTGTGGGA